MLPEKNRGSIWSPSCPSVRLFVRPYVRTYVPNWFLAHNFVMWSRILNIFYRNNYHIEMMCRAQHLGRYLEGQGHSITLQLNRIRPLTSLFEVWFYNHLWQLTSLFNTYSGSITRFDRLLFSLKSMPLPFHCSPEFLDCEHSNYTVSKSTLRN